MKKLLLTAAMLATATTAVAGDYRTQPWSSSPRPNSWAPKVEFTEPVVVKKVVETVVVVEEKVEAKPKSTFVKNKPISEAAVETGNTIPGICDQLIRERMTHPSSVKFSWFGGQPPKQYYNFKPSSSYPHRMVRVQEGTALNGFGNRIPFTASCKLDFNDTHWKVAEILIR